MSDAIEETKGRAKEAVGAATGQDDIKEEGKAQQEREEKKDEAQQAAAEAQEKRAEAQEADAEAKQS